VESYDEVFRLGVVKSKKASIDVEEQKKKEEKSKVDVGLIRTDAPEGNRFLYLVRGEKFI
jgi:hypothetical protein